MKSASLRTDGVVLAAATLSGAENARVSAVAGLVLAALARPAESPVSAVDLVRIASLLALIPAALLALPLIAVRDSTGRIAIKSFVC